MRKYSNDAMASNEPLWNEISLNPCDYSGELSDSKKHQLLESLAHEYLHTHEPIWQRIHEAWITDEYTPHHKAISDQSIDLSEEAYDAMIEE